MELPEVKPRRAKAWRAWSASTAATAAIWPEVAASDGMGGGGMPGFGGDGGMSGDFGGAPDGAQQQGSTSEAITTGVAIIVLLLGMRLLRSTNGNDSKQ
ncbi:hypothetical protein PAECIP111892_00233 [Paenibacillus auburnensis]|uniref:Uncharacterized protein n=2 Tax=Paenibacillus auburnensis TaxID=2905649 RepID=A0ABM9BME3_9BACL|nr:hypothetical protein PAECIP111892_00233 [Paenibacillus auburnensis]